MSNTRSRARGIYWDRTDGGHRPVSNCNREEMGRHAEACLDGKARRA